MQCVRQGRKLLSRRSSRVTTLTLGRNILSAANSGTCVGRHSRATTSKKLFTRQNAKMGKEFSVPDEEHGVFQNQHRKPFPLRAAMDIGAGGVLSLCIARVDVKIPAMQKLLYHTQLPLHLDPMRSADGGEDSTSFVLSERSVTDIVNKMEVLTGAITRIHRQYGGVDERAAVITWPLCLAQNAQTVAEQLTQQFKVNVKVLGKDFHLYWPLENQQGESVRHTAAQRDHSTETPLRHTKRDPCTLQALLREYSTDQTTTPRGASMPGTGLCTTPPVNATTMECLAFLAHATASQCVAPQRLLVVDEDPHSGVRLVAANTTALQDCMDKAEAPKEEERRREVLRREGLDTGSDAAPLPEGPLVHYRLPIAVPDAHRLCFADIQHRRLERYHLHHSSLNPVLRSEFLALRDLLVGMIQPHLPSWARRKSVLGGVIAGTSFNGGLLNVAARVAQKSPIALEHLETHAEFFYCGLTDVLLGVQFPHPGMVLPSAALASALCRALATPRVSYLPEVSTAVGLLLQPGLWLREVRLDDQPFFQSVSNRVFHRPHFKDNPTAAPGAEWVDKRSSWNMKNFHASTKGTTH